MAGDGRSISPRRATATEAIADELLSDVGRESRPEVTLTDFDPDGEIKVVAAALYAVSDLPDDQLFAVARRMSADDRATRPARLRRRPWQTVATSPAGRSSGRRIASTSSPTTAHFAICSGIVC